MRVPISVPGCIGWKAADPNEILACWDWTRGLLSSVFYLQQVLQHAHTTGGGKKKGKGASRRDRLV